MSTTSLSVCTSNPGHGVRLVPLVVRRRCIVVALRSVAVGLASVLLLVQSVCAQAEPAGPQSKVVQLSPGWDKTFPRSKRVEHHKVSFKNRYGITLAADIYLPKDHGTPRLAALVVDGPFGSVKEQVSGFYAQAMAERGYVTIAFDRSYMRTSKRPAN